MIGDSSKNLFFNFSIILSEKEYNEYQETFIKQEKWLADFYEKNPDSWFPKEAKKIPLALIPIIDEDVVLSFADWKTVREQNPDVHKDSDQDDLVNGLISMNCTLPFQSDEWTVKEWVIRWKWYIWMDQDWTILRIPASLKNDTEKPFIDAYTLWLLWD